jgi:hypothetical protein
VRDVAASVERRLQRPGGEALIAEDVYNVANV